MSARKQLRVFVAYRDIFYRGIASIVLILAAFSKAFGGIMTKKYRTPPFLTPAAIVSLIIAISAGNLAVNVATGTKEGGQVAPRQTSVVSSVTNSSQVTESVPSSTSSSSTNVISSSTVTSSLPSSSSSRQADVSANSTPASSSAVSSSTSQVPDKAVSATVPETTPTGGGQ